MRIISLEAENVKRLTAVSISPKGDVVEITGKNGAGKTSVLDCIAWALQGKEVIQKRPVRKGEKQAVIRLDLGEVRVTRKIIAKGDAEFTTSITLESADGARFPSPQTMLDSLLGELTFDPLAFTRMKPKEQADALRALVPGVDFDKIDGRIETKMEARRDLSRDLRVAKDKLTRSRPVDDAPEAPVDISGLMERYQKAADENAAVAGERHERSAELRRAGELEDRCKEIERQINALKKEHGKLVEERAAVEERMKGRGPLPEPIDLSGIQDEITAARAANERFAAAEDRRKAAAAVKTLEDDVEDMTAEIEALRREKREAVENADLPVPGLSLDEDGVTLDGLPFAQAADSMQLRASIAIAAAMNPKLRVVRVRDGSLLDEDAMAALAAFAAEHDLQVWIETVTSGRPSAVVIADGAVERINDGRRGDVAPVA